MLHQDLIKTLQDVFGQFARVRPSHAKGIFLRGVFIPNDDAKRISIASHFSNPSTAVIARFSLFIGIPDLASTDPRANPHGLAVRFLIDESHDIKTDIVCHASTLFPGSNGEEVLSFFQSLRDNSIDEYIKHHPAAAAFVQEDRPTPKSFAHESFYSINAFKFIDADGESVLVRYRWIPLAGSQYLTQGELDDKHADFLFDELPDLLAKEPIRFKLVVQIAEDGDVTDDCTKIWPEDRKTVELGVLKLESVIPKEELSLQKSTPVFSPIPGVEGIEPSADPILATRAAVYSQSGQTRRTADI
ncbi:Catalase-related peroxidase-like protein [Cladobotryum mycophilum]|uniref:Catalase-related peroxidase-like protein n=1 Tax=Cladobotryum mycophilum TaxID=491253 RepID=A0ABR0SP87_9HYPO